VAYGNREIQPKEQIDGAHRTEDETNRYWRQRRPG